MCDSPKHVKHGWKGWPSWSAVNAACATGQWHDLSHPLNADLPVPKIFPSPSFKRVMSMPTEILNVTRIDMVCHLGTHMDAPNHVLLDGPAMHAVPQAYFHGSGVVWEIQAKPQSPISVADLQIARPLIEPGDILLISTGWATRFGTEHYFNNPYLTQEAADWIVQAGVKWVGIDFVSPELPFAMRPANFSYPVHRKLLSHGVLIVENLADCSSLHNRRVEVVCGALNIEDADGAPARIFARTID